MSEVDWDLVATHCSAQIDYERQLQVNADRSDIFYAIRADMLTSQRPLPHWAMKHLSSFLGNGL